MKRGIILFGLCTLTFSLSSYLPKNVVKKPKEAKLLQKAESYVVDIDKSKIYWSCEGVGKEHNGYVSIQSGSMLIDTKTITSGFFYINMKSITNTDVKDAGFRKNLEDHLKSQDFFFSAKYPTSTLKIVKSQRLDVPEGQPNYKINGDLTIKGIKKPIDFLATLKYAKKTVHISGNVAINRTDWEVKYNSGNFFQDLGDKLIQDTVNIKLDLVADMK
jgi:polyisoprenoid-binding protein YceI